MGYDVLVIGGGVVGCAIVRELSRLDLSAVLAERCGDVAEGGSRANSAIVHAGYDCEPGTLMARLNVTGNALYEGMCDELSVPFKRTGSLVLAFDEKQEVQLQKLYDQGVMNGVPGMEILSGPQALEREPSLNPAVTAALWAPTCGITGPYELTVALADNAVMNGAQVLTDWEVSAIERKDDGFIAVNPAGESIEARFIVNAAGLYADEVNAMAGGEAFTIRPRKGEYMLMDRAAGDILRTVIFQTPSDMGKGILVSPTTHGNFFAGPTAMDIEDKLDTATTDEGTAELKAKALRSVPALPLNQTIRGFAGLRAIIPDIHDFLIRAEDKVPGFINVAGICSPGLTSAPAIALYVLDLLREQGLSAGAKPGWQPQRFLPKPFREMTDGERRQAIAENPRYGHIVCRCEAVTEAEIVAAITAPVPARTVDAVKRRTRAGMGRCQGGFCMPRVLALLAEHQGVPLTQVEQGDRGSWLVLPGKDQAAGETP